MSSKIRICEENSKQTAYFEAEKEKKMKKNLVPLTILITNKKVSGTWVLGFAG